METPELLEIAFSHFCEKARWALDHHHIPYVRRSHLPLVTRLMGRRFGVWNTVPILLTESGLITESSDIIKWCDRKGEGSPLWEETAGVESEITEWVSLFDKKLGPSTRRLAYFHLLDHDELIDPMFLSGISPLEKTLARPFLPLLKKVIRKTLKIDAPGAERSRREVELVWAKVEARLAAGHQFLVADKFTAADLTFAALAAPLYSPPGYGAAFPAFEQLPAAARKELGMFRDSPAGQFGLQLYKDFR